MPRLYTPVAKPGQVLVDWFLVEGLEDFGRWLTEQRLRSEGTATLYQSDVRLALSHPRGPLGRLGDRKLSPNTRRHSLAALRAWARYTQDAELLAELDEARLPPAERITEPTPLSEEEWRDLIEAVEKDDEMDPAVKSACGMIIIRGVRVGDVCRLSRERAKKALHTGVLTMQAKGERQLVYDAEPISWCLETVLEDPRPWGVLCELISRRAKDQPRAARLKLERAIADLADRAGLDGADVHPHRMRRSYACAFYEACGRDLERLRAHMGWANLATAARYVDHSRREELDSIASGMMKKIRGKKR